MGGNQDMRIVSKGGCDGSFELSGGIIGKSPHDLKPVAADLGIKSWDGLIRAAEVANKQEVIEQDRGVFVVTIAAIGPAIVPDQTGLGREWSNVPIGEIDQILILLLKKGHLGANLRYRAAIEVMVSQNEEDWTIQTGGDRCQVTGDGVCLADVSCQDEGIGSVARERLQKGGDFGLVEEIEVDVSEPCQSHEDQSTNSGSRIQRKSADTPTTRSQHIIDNSLFFTILSA